VVLEFFDIPPLDSLDLMAASIPHLNIQLSPETHDPEIRAAFGRPYNNQRMEEMIERILKLGCHKFDLFFMIGLPGQNTESVMDTVEYIDQLLMRVGNGKNLFPYISPLAPFLDPGSRVFENPKEYGYRLFYRTLEEHRRALLQPSWKQMLSYETDWMTRDQIVESTYESASRLNRVKYNHGLIKPNKFKEIEKRINQARNIIRAIDERLAQGGSSGIRSEDAGSSARSLQVSTICDKDELKWPVRFFRLNLPRGPLKFLSLLRIKNILSLILRGDDSSPKTEKESI
jgi:radical SAM superfamily enzyme YgiQ (UPF0313 family)